jgi:hypothetical protein
VIDRCNSISLAFAIPVAVFDVSKIAEYNEVRYATGAEVYLAFSREIEHPEPHGVIFPDSPGRAHARRWTNRQSGCGEGGNRGYPIVIIPPPPDDPRKTCNVTIKRPGMISPFFDGCADEGMKLFWAADCVGDQGCCRDKLTKQADYETPCLKYADRYFFKQTNMLSVGLCCKNKTNANSLTQAGKQGHENPS